jgi:hypothetical protein
LQCLWIFSYRINLLLYNADANVQGQWAHYKLPMWSLWTAISITKYSRKWFDLSLNSSYWIKLFFSLKIIADLRWPFKPLRPEFSPILHVPVAAIGNPIKQHRKCAKVVCSNEVTETFGFKWLKLKLWLFFCHINCLPPSNYFLLSQKWYEVLKIYFLKILLLSSNCDLIQVWK